MSRILTRLLVEPLDNREWRVARTFVYESDLVGRIRVPRGFVFDGNSIPRCGWVWTLPTDFLEAGCVHDWLYRTHRVARKTADRVYLEILTLKGMSAWRRYGRYYALRLFGWWAYWRMANRIARRFRAILPLP